MPALLTTDYLAAEALTICRAVGRHELEVQVEDKRHCNGCHTYYLTAYDSDTKRNTFNLHTALAQGSTAERALADLAGQLDCAWPIQFSTVEQREQLIRVLNHPVFGYDEKQEVLLACGMWATAYAEQQLTALRQEGLRRVAGEHPLGVVAEVFTVAAAAA